jgi:hypothetical protein
LSFLIAPSVFTNVYLLQHNTAGWEKVLTCACNCMEQNEWRWHIPYINGLTVYLIVEWTLTHVKWRNLIISYN